LTPSRRSRREKLLYVPPLPFAIEVGIDKTQVLAREQAVEKKEAELAAREAALAAKETPAPAEPEAAKEEPAVEAEKAVEPEAVVSFPHPRIIKKIKSDQIKTNTSPARTSSSCGRGEGRRGRASCC
jgi:hypothetical protein